MTTQSARLQRNSRRQCVVLSIALLLLFTLSFVQTVRAQGGIILFESFGSDPPTYIPSIPEFTDGANDFFTRTDGSNISASYDVGNNGFAAFAAQDIDGEGDSPEQSITFPIYVGGSPFLEFEGSFAEDDATDGNEDYDADDYVIVEVQIDGGGFFPIFAIRNDGSTFNSAPFVDTDFDGVGDGVEITDSFQSFFIPIPGSGTRVDLRIRMRLNAGDEDIAIGHILFVASPGPDEIAPSCSFDGLDDGPPRTADFSLADAESGIVSVAVDGGTTNTTVEIPAGSGNFYGSGETASFFPADVAVAAQATQIDSSVPSDVALTVTDDYGNTASCSAQIPADAPEDTVPPVCGAVTLEANGGTYEIISSASDDVGIASVTITRLTANLEAYVDEAGPFAEGDVVPVASAASVDLRARVTVPSGAFAFLATVADAAGNEAVCDPVITDLAGALPETTALLPSYPNPLRGGVAVAVPFTLAEAADVRLVVYDVLGRAVAVLADEALEAGRYEVTWAEAAALPAGTYVVRLTAGASVQTQRLTLVR